eukprot:11864682-Alexandrium_andersonii.AAC.1
MRPDENNRSPAQPLVRAGLERPLAEGHLAVQRACEGSTALGPFRQDAVKDLKLNERPLEIHRNSRKSAELQHESSQRQAEVLTTRSPGQARA